MAAHPNNKYALGNNGGRPPKFETVELLEAKINDYFEGCKPEYDEENNLISPNYPTVTGLALYLGFADRKSLYEYRNKEEFSSTIKRALSTVENHYETKLNYQGSTGAIFALKNMGWEDKQNHDHTTKGESLNDISKLSTDELIKRAKALKEISDNS